MSTVFVEETNGSRRQIKGKAIAQWMNLHRNNSLITLICSMKYLEPSRQSDEILVNSKILKIYVYHFVLLGFTWYLAM